MRPNSFLRHFAFLAIAMAIFVGSRPATAQTTIAVGSEPRAIAVDSTRNKIYVANEGSNSVTVIDGSNNTTRTVPVGPRPQHIVVNTKTNRIYANNGGDSSVSMIDGATLAVTRLAVGSFGPMLVNERDNKLYILRSGSTDEVTLVDTAANTWYSIAIYSYWPMALAHHPGLNKLYVANHVTGDVRVVDLTSTSDFPPSVSVKVWNQPTGLALNTNTGRLYVITEETKAPIIVLNTADNSTTDLSPAGHGVGPRAVALNASTNKVYAAFNNEVIVVDGATNAMTFLATPSAVGIAINPNNNRIYVPGADGTMAIINGATHAVTKAGIPPGARAVAVNPTTGRVYILGTAVTMLEGGAAPPPPPPPPPNPPSPPDTAAHNVQGLWWAAPASVESGWGMNLAHQGEILFATWFTYDTDGSGMWLVMSNGNKTGANKYSGELYRTTGPAFSGTFDSTAVHKQRVGTATLEFTDANNGRLSATVNNVPVQKAITRQMFASPAPTCTAGGSAGAQPNYQDLWWKSPAGSESGWGLNITHQGDILFVTWFTYAANGRGMWLVGSSVNRTGNATYSGKLYRTFGPPFNASPWNPAHVVKEEVGTVSLAFGDADNGVLSYTVSGVTQSKAITRQAFASPRTVCR
ncbi:MAG TPA: YncE family protein [Usitatibacter sp.]|nr:YncE family protein [Usitatibacter sp.]